MYGNGIAGEEPRDLRCVVDAATLDYLAICIAIGADEIDGLAAADADTVRDVQYRVAVNVDLAAAGNTQAAVEIRRGRTAATGADDIDGTLVIEDVVAGTRGG